jgi:hypothetical protein
MVISNTVNKFNLKDIVLYKNVPDILYYIIAVHWERLTDTYEYWISPIANIHNEFSAFEFNLSLSNINNNNDNITNTVEGNTNC